MQNLLPLTETERRHVRKVARGVWPGLVLFALLVPGFGFLFLLTITDDNFRASDGYVVAGFTGFMTLGGVAAMWESWRIKARMGLILVSNQKRVLAGQVTKVMNHGTLRRPKIYWEIKGVSQPVAVRLISINALDGLKSVHEVEAGDWVEVHQAVDELTIVAIVKLNTPVGISHPAASCRPS